MNALINKFNKIISTKKGNPLVDVELREISEILSEFNLVDFISQKLSYKEKLYSFELSFFQIREDLAFKMIDKDIINFDKEYEKSPEKTFILLKSLNSVNVLNKKIINWAREKYNLNNDVQKLNQLLISSKNLTALSLFEKEGFNIWNVVEKEHGIETLLPCIIRNKEVLKEGVSSKQIDFFLSRKEKWENISTNKTTNDDFRHRIIFTFSNLKDKYYLNFINDIGYKNIKDINWNLKDSFNNKLYSGYEILIGRKKHLIVKDLIKKNQIKDLSKDEIFKLWLTLLTSEPRHGSSVFKNGKNKILKRGSEYYKIIWDFLVSQIEDINYKFEGKNVVENIFSLRKSKLDVPLYLPKENNTNVYQKYWEEYYSINSSRADSMSNLIFFLKSKNFNFFEKDNNIKEYTYSNMILYLLKQNMYSSEYSKKLLETLDEIWINQHIDVKLEVLNDFIENIDDIITEDVLRFYKNRSLMNESSDLFCEIINLFKKGIVEHKDFNHPNYFQKVFKLIENEKINMISKDKTVLQEIIYNIKVNVEYLILNQKLDLKEDRLKSKVIKL